MQAAAAMITATIVATMVVMFYKKVFFYDLASCLCIYIAIDCNSVLAALTFMLSIHVHFLIDIFALFYENLDFEDLYCCSTIFATATTTIPDTTIVKAIILEQYIYYYE